MRGYGHEPSSPSISAADRLITAANAINATLYDKLAFDISRNIVPVGSLARTPNVMEVHPSVPVRTVREFIAYAKGDLAGSPMERSTEQTYGWRAVQNDGWGRFSSRAISRIGAHAYRLARRAGTSRFR
jgi:hypothetical protein